MALIKRIGFYLIGFSIGLVFMVYFFKEKRVEFCYFPNCRVLKEIRTKELSFSTNIKNDSLYTLEEIKETILKNGNVDFGQSEVHSEPCKTYLIKGIIRKKEIELNVEFCSERSVITSIKTIAK